MGSLMDEEGVPVMANLCLTDSFENPKRGKIRVRIRLIDKPAPTEKVSFGFSFQILKPFVTVIYECKIST